MVSVVEVEPWKLAEVVELVVVVEVGAGGGGIEVVVVDL